jgi:hypothetical protein
MAMLQGIAKRQDGEWACEFRRLLRKHEVGDILDDAKILEEEDDVLWESDLRFWGEEDDIASPLSVTKEVSRMSWHGVCV